MEKSRIEQILKYGLGEVSTLPSNLSRIEKLLVKLISDGIGGGKMEVDSEFSETSTNPVENRVITEKLNILEGDGEGSIYRMIAFEIAKLVAEAPDSLNTLQEIAAWITHHEEDAAAMNLQILNNSNAIASKVDKVLGKQLSTNDYTTEEKEKLESIDLEKFVKKTDIATFDNMGVSYVKKEQGLNIENGALKTDPASDNMIHQRVNIWKPLVSKHIPIFMSDYGLNDTTIPEMEERIVSIEQTIENVDRILEEVL